MSAGCGSERVNRGPLGNCNFPILLLPQGTRPGPLSKLNQARGMQEEGREAWRRELAAMPEVVPMLLRRSSSPVSVYRRGRRASFPSVLLPPLSRAGSQPCMGVFDRLPSQAEAYEEKSQDLASCTQQNACISLSALLDTALRTGQRSLSGSATEAHGLARDLRDRQGRRKSRPCTFLEPVPLETLGMDELALLPSSPAVRPASISEGAGNTLSRRTGNPEAAHRVLSSRSIGRDGSVTDAHELARGFRDISSFGPSIDCCGNMLPVSRGGRPLTRGRVLGFLL